MGTGSFPGVKQSGRGTDPHSIWLGIPIWRVAANKLNKQSRTADEGWSSSLGVGRGANSASPWKPVMKYPHGEMLPLETKQSGGKLLPHSDLRGGVFLEEAPLGRQRKRDIVLGTWNVRSLYRAGSLTEVTRELARYKLHLVGVQEVRWDKGGTVTAGDYNFLL